MALPLALSVPVPAAPVALLEAVPAPLEGEALALAVLVGQPEAVKLGVAAVRVQLAERLPVALAVPWDTVGWEVAVAVSPAWRGEGEGEAVAPADAEAHWEMPAEAEAAAVPEGLWVELSHTVAVARGGEGEALGVTRQGDPVLVEDAVAAAAKEGVPGEDSEALADALPLSVPPLTEACPVADSVSEAEVVGVWQALAVAQ